jgi:hypothetical protein
MKSIKRKITGYTKWFIQCPNCNKSDFEVNHIKIGSTAGPWFCHEDDCGVGFKLKRVSESQFETTLLDNETMKTVFILLQYRDDPEFQIIVEGIESRRKEAPEWLLASQDDPDGHHEYFYNEHTCPTNYLTGVYEAIYHGDHDPHGIFEFVRRLSDEERLELLNKDKMPWQLERERIERENKFKHKQLEAKSE